MRFQSATKTALGAAAIASILTFVQSILTAVDLLKARVPLAQTILVLMSGVSWIFFGLLTLFLILTFWPQSQRKGTIALGGSALVQLIFALWRVYLILTVPQWHSLLGYRTYFVLVELAAPLVLLVFSYFLAQKDRGPGLRVTALVAVISLVVGVIYQTFFLGQFDVFAIFDGVATAFIAQWFWVLFLEGRKIIWLKDL